MASVVDISNLAIGHAGGNPIQSLDDPTVEADSCRQFYPIARDALLQQYAWGFATRRAALSQVVIDANLYPDFGYAYALPSDFLRLTGLVTPTGLAPLEMLGDHAIEVIGTDRVLLCHLDTLLLRYGATVNEPARFSPLFVVALSYQLGSMIVGPLRKERRMIADLANQARVAAIQASGVDASEGNSAESVRRDYRAPWHAKR